jgi:hypothetical protein
VSEEAGEEEEGGGSEGDSRYDRDVFLCDSVDRRSVEVFIVNCSDSFHVSPVDVIWRQSLNKRIHQFPTIQ